MVELTMFEAGKGDFFWLTYGKEKNMHHILIDGGEKSASILYRKTLLEIKNKGQIVDAIIFTHIDNDHIIVALPRINDMSEGELPVIQAVYFNTGNAVCRMQNLMKIKNPEEFPLLKNRIGQHSVKKAMSLLQILKAKRLNEVLKEYTIQGECIFLSGGAELDIISPDKEGLKNLALKWNKEILPMEKDGGQHRSNGRGMSEYEKNIEEFLDNTHDEDSSVTNRSSIAFIFQYESVKIAFLGDASPSVCIEGTKRFFPEGVEVDLIKLAHHGSGANISDEMLGVIKSQSYLLSTTGEKLSKYLWSRLVKGGRKSVVYCNYDWWKRIYCQKYFSDKDIEEYLKTKRLETRLIAYEGEKIKDGLWLYRTRRI